jgi:alpha-tubulin suppressor-like RCC1 family protein/lysophospholipase L1-like esterase
MRREIHSACALVAIVASFASGASAAPTPGTTVNELSAGGERSFASYSHSCAVVDGGVQCWGAAAAGQLGDGIVVRRRPLPVRVHGLPGPVSPSAGQLAAGGAHSCALVEGGALCWGANTSGQSGVERPLFLLDPTAVPALPQPVAQVAAGAAHTCAVAAGELWCWGRNESGEVGVVPDDDCRERHSVRPCRAAPRRVPGLEGVAAALALGERHTCVLIGGGVWCWGANARGQLGDGTRDWRARPRLVVGLPGPARAIAAGRNHSCASVEGGVYCWGANVRGQLAAAEADDRLEPTAVSGIDAAPDALAAGGERTCAAHRGAVLCWGDGQAAPAPVEGVAGAVSALAVGFDHACAALQGAGVHCWGDGDFGQLGSGDAPRDHAQAVAVGAWDDGRIRDRDGDGQIRVACLGDSNTRRRRGGPRGWCGRLGDALPSDRWQVVNRGLGGATVATRASLRNAEGQLTYAIENDAPDAVILAFGTNDLLADVPSAEIVDAYRSHALRIYEAGALPFVALTPPVQPASHALNARVRELNGALRAAFAPERLIDFWSGFGAADFTDALHLGDAGHERRAQAAAAVLLQAAAPAPAP